MNIKQRDKLLLQESYFKLMHLLSPYFAQVVLNRLKDTYISPQLEMAWDIQFFRVCTVSSYLINIPCLLLKHFQKCLGSCPFASYISFAGIHSCGHSICLHHFPWLWSSAIWLGSIALIAWRIFTTILLQQLLEPHTNGASLSWTHLPELWFA